MELKKVIKRETVRQYKEKIREEEERIRKLENSSMLNSEGKFHQRHFERAVGIICGFLLYGSLRHAKPDNGIIWLIERIKRDTVIGCIYMEQRLPQ